MTSFMEAFLPAFRRNLAYSKMYQCLPFDWNEKQKKFTLNETWWRRVSIRIWIILGGLYIGFQIAYLVFGRHDLADRIVGLLILAVYCCCFGSRAEFEPDFTPIGILNRLLCGNEPQLKQPLLTVVKLMCILTELTYFVLPTGFALMGALIPCKPPLLGSFILCSSTGSSFLGKLFGVPILAFLEFVMAMQSGVSGTYYAIYSQVSGVILLWSSCQKFMTLKRTSTDFLLNGYRCLQIQERMHNSSYSGRILPVFILCIPLIEVLSGFALVALFHKANLFQTSIFLVMHLEATLLLMIVLTSASSIYVKAEDWISRVKSGSGKNIAYFRRLHKSFRPLRLEFGNNFVDRLTPLMMQEFCVRQTASLLVLARV